MARSTIPLLHRPDDDDEISRHVLQVSYGLDADSRSTSSRIARRRLRTAQRAVRVACVLAHRTGTNAIDALVRRKRQHARISVPRRSRRGVRASRRRPATRRTRRAATERSDSSDGDGPPARPLQRARGPPRCLCTRSPPARVAAYYRPKTRNPESHQLPGPCRASCPLYISAPGLSPAPSARTTRRYHRPMGRARCVLLRPIGPQ